MLVYRVTTLKTNDFPLKIDNWWLEDAIFPFGMVPYHGTPTKTL